MAPRTLVFMIFAPLSIGGGQEHMIHQWEWNVSGQIALV